jgi:hypothetical protein
VSGVYTFAHYEQFPPVRFGSGTYLTFRTEDEARQQVQAWLEDSRFDYVCLFKQRTRTGSDLVEQISREVFQAAAGHDGQ